MKNIIAFGVEFFTKTFKKQKWTDCRTISCQEVRFYLDEKKKFRIYYQNKEITKWSGLSTGIFSEGRWYSSTECNFRVEKVSQEEMFVYFDFKPLSLVQVWHIIAMSHGSLSWDVLIQLKKTLRIDRRNAALFLSKNYQEWTVPLTQGLFPALFTPAWENMTQAEDSLEFIGVISSSEEFPSITLKNDQGFDAELVIQNTDERFSARVLKMQFEEKKEIYGPGTYHYFKSIVEFYPDKITLEDKLEEIRQRYQRSVFLQQEAARKKLEEQEEAARKKLVEQEEAARKKLVEQKAQEKRNRTIQKGNLKIYLDEVNRIHIYNNGCEITKWQGLYIDILSEGRWFGSSDSKIDIEKLSPQELVVHLAHNQIPINYQWHLLLKDSNLLWEVSIQVRDPLRIDQSNASIFLTKAYNGWVSSLKDGRFPPFKPDWLTLHCVQEKPYFVAAIPVSQELPTLVLHARHNQRDSRLAVQNSDATLSSRVLTIQHEEERELMQPGTYFNFKAFIKLYQNTSDFKNIVGRLRRKPVRGDNLLHLTDNFVLESPETLTAQENEVLLFGDTETLHDKISGSAGDFEKVISKLKLPLKQHLNMKIGISKYNFFKLNEIVRLCSTLINQRTDVRSVSLDIFPVRKLYDNFIEYIKELESRIHSDSISFFLKDQELPQLLYSISSQADQYNEKDLLRLLGVIAEHPFVGPQTLVIDTFHGCNTNCIHCWIHTPIRKLSAEAKKVKMGMSLFKSVVDNAVELLCDEIIFQGDGEPLLDDRFFEMAAYARNKGLKVLFFTNAILLDEEKAKKIIDLEINEIFCSLPAGTEKTYALINSARTKTTFQKIVSNLRYLMSLREKSGRNKPLLQMTHVIHNLNYYELEEMAKTDLAIGADKTRFYLARLDENIKSLRLEAEQIESMKKALVNVEQSLKRENIELQNNIKFQLQNYNPETGDWSEKLPFRLGCPVGWFFSLILAKGEVSMCCHLRIIDSVNGRSFKEIWNSREYNDVRVQAKYLTENKDVTFNNGVKLYDEFCKHCDTHQVIFRINELLDKYNLSKFLSKPPKP